MDATQQRPLVRLNEPAPDFEANTTQGPIKLSDGRNRDEILRVVDALQMNDTHGVATPAN